MTNDNEAAVASGPVAAGASPDSGSGGLNGGERDGGRERGRGDCANLLMNWLALAEHHLAFMEAAEANFRLGSKI